MSFWSAQGVIFWGVLFFGEGLRPPLPTHGLSGVGESDTYVGTVERGRQRRDAQGCMARPVQGRGRHLGGCHGCEATRDSWDLVRAAGVGLGGWLSDRGGRAAGNRG